MASFVILDRDGVINAESPEYIKSPDEWEPLPGSLDAIARLTKAGFQVFVATNQAGIARGKLSLVELDIIHQRMLNEVEQLGGRIVDIRYCPHHPDDHCNCRKPAPGMLLDLAKIYNLDLSMGHFVGDSIKDLQAAKAAGCKGVLVLSGNGHESLKLFPDFKPVHKDLASFASQLLYKTRHPN